MKRIRSPSQLARDFYFKEEVEFAPYCSTIKTAKKV
jgi:hypothetical protein